MVKPVDYDNFEVRTHPMMSPSDWAVRDERTARRHGCQLAVGCLQSFAAALTPSLLHSAAAAHSWDAIMDSADAIMVAISLDRAFQSWGAL